MRSDDGLHGEGAATESHEERYLARLDGLLAAASDLGALLTQLVANGDQMRRELEQGRRIFDAITAVSDEAGRSFRREVHDATRRLENAMQATRGESFRILMAEGGYTVAGIARAAELSPQMVKRLLRTVETDAATTTLD